ncbi:MAG TPA: glycine cleavage system protein GcvH [Verrucomicrobiae bacterium]|nr:glycine cleavage system protein GcvH [Verrucomicrobiae bacterium]
MNIPKNLKYAKSHEWVRVEGNTAVVGITDHAQNELSDVVYVEVPAVGARVEAGKECAVVESVKAASDIYAPVSGDVAAVNEELSNAPEALNQDPYGKGWMFTITMSDPGELGELLNPDDYAHHIGA